MRYKIIVLPDKKVQIRTHKKKRINKKWAKRYGVKRLKNQLLKNNQMLIMASGEVYMNEETYSTLKRTILIVREKGSTWQRDIL